MKTHLAQMRQRKLQLKNIISPQNGGINALNFVNTLQNRGSENPKDYLTNYEDFVYWCYRAGVIEYDHYNQLSLEGYCYSQEATGVFEEVIKTRFMLYEIFLSVIKAESADEIFMRQFNLAINTASKYLRYESTVNGMQLAWFNIDEEIASPLWIIIKSAGDLLLEADPEKIKQCKTCGSMFFDTTKNGIRRWCNRSACGHLLRAKRYYDSKKGIKVGVDDDG
jgi:predicted RNA-binding Zn ribbon-like protein